MRQLDAMASSGTGIEGSHQWIQADHSNSANWAQWITWNVPTKPVWHSQNFPIQHTGPYPTMPMKSALKCHHPFLKTSVSHPGKEFIVRCIGLCTFIRTDTYRQRYKETVERHLEHVSMSSLLSLTRDAFGRPEGVICKKERTSHQTEKTIQLHHSQLLAERLKWGP